MDLCSKLKRKDGYAELDNALLGHHCVFFAREAHREISARGGRAMKDETKTGLHFEVLSFSRRRKSDC